jgi:hypothetical protein
MSESNMGVKQMESLLRRQQMDLQKLMNEAKELKAKSENKSKSSFERDRSEKRLRMLVLPQIVRLKQSIATQTSMLQRVKNLKNITNKAKAKAAAQSKVANRAVTLKANKPANKPGFFQGLFTRKAPAASTTTSANSSMNNLRRRLNALRGPAAPVAPRVNHLTPAQRRELNEFEAELMASPEWEAMQQKNLAKEKIKLNLRAAKNERQRKYYENMLRGLENANNGNGTENLNAMLNELEGFGAGAGSSGKALTAEEERELDEYLARLGGGRRKSRKASRRRLTRRRR